MTSTNWSTEPPIDRIDLSKLRKALEAMRVAFQRGRPLVFAPDRRLVERGLIDFGCLGTWPDVRPLARWVQALATCWGCQQDEAFARFDETLDWILDEPAPPPLWEL